MSRPYRARTLTRRCEAEPHTMHNQRGDGSNKRACTKANHLKGTQEKCKVRAPMQDGGINVRCEHQCEQQWTDMATDEDGL